MLNVKKLGATQANVARCLVEHGSFRYLGGWYWDSFHGTIKIMDRLVERGVAEKKGDGREAVYYPSHGYLCHLQSVWMKRIPGEENGTRLSIIRNELETIHKRMKESIKRKRDNE